MELLLDEFVKEDLQPGFTPYYIYRMNVANAEVGTLVFRTGSDAEHYYDGHIAYTVEEEYRGHHYAYQGCLLLKKEIRKQGYDHVLITCDPENAASKKTILKLGGMYMETVRIPKAQRKFFNAKEKIKEIYRWEV